MDFGGAAFAVGNSSLIVAEGIITAGYRRVKHPRDVGFYYGTDLVLGVPFAMAYYDNRQLLKAPPGNDLFLGLRIPFGHRWPGDNRSMGFYLGGGPAIQMVSDWDQHTIYGLGVFGELGWQTNKLSGTGFHFGMQLSFNPFVFSAEEGPIARTVGVGASMQFGMSWRREKN